MTKNRQFRFYQQTKNCQLTDNRILLTEKTFTLIFRVITIADLSLSLVLLSKSSKVLDHMLRKEYTVYCFEILWIGYMLRYHTDGFPESPTTVSLLLC